MWRLVMALVVALALGTAVAAQTRSNSQLSPDGSQAVSAAPPITQLDYRLGSGDHVRIIVFGEPDLTNEFAVPGGDGVISFPLVGDIHAGGLTVGELQAALQDKLRDGYLKDPRVSIEVLNYRPFYILGEVTKPGEYPYTNGLTVLNAVATANGFTYRADTRRVFIKRASEPYEREYPLSSVTQVAPGDTIRIKERFF